MPDPLDELPETQGGVDHDPNSGQLSHARAQGGPDARAMAETIENDAHLQELDSIRDIILAHPRVRVLVVASAVKSLDAHRCYFSRDEKKMVREPDYGTQMKAVAWLAAYSDGLPVVTNVNVNTTATKGKSRADDLDALARSPAALKAAKRMIEEAERRAKVLAVESAPAVEVTSKSEAT